jgi:hypothetical protein
MEKEVPITAQYLIDRESAGCSRFDRLLMIIDGVKFNHHDEKNVFLEFDTSE